MAKLYRYLQFDRTQLNEGDRSIPIAFSSEQPVDRGDYDEVLDHTAEGMDLTRLKDSHPVLVNHNPYDQVGVIDSAEISSDKKGRAVIRFGNSARATEIFNDVREGIRKHISVGYERIKTLSTSKSEAGRSSKRFSWRPFEVSIVPVPADTTVGVGRSEDDPPDPAKVDASALPNANRASETPQPSPRLPMSEPVTPPVVTPPDPKIVEAERTALVGKTVETERKRTKGIRAALDRYCELQPKGEPKFRELALKALDGDTSSEDFAAQCLAAMEGVRKADLMVAEDVMDGNDPKQYSIRRAIQSVIDTRKPIPEGLEGDVHHKVAERMKGMGAAKGGGADGFWVPFERAIPAGTISKRDLNVTTFGQGGAFVATTLVTPVIELLRNKMVASRLGIQTMAGLTGNVAIPRQTGAATAYSLPETATLTKSNQAIDQVLLAPHRVGATQDYSKQLLLQSSVDVENFLRDDLMKVIAIKIDKLVLEGSGAGSEPTGILNTTGIGSIHFGAAATLAKMVAFETSLANANADLGKMAYVTTPTVRGVLKVAPKVGTTFPIFIWEDGEFGDGTNDGDVNGYRAAATNQISNNAVAFGNFDDVILAMWGGLDVVVDPFSRATDGVIRITINTFIDVALRHSASFCWSDDSGAQ